MFISRPKVFHGQNLKTSDIIMDSRVRGSSHLVASNIHTLTAHKSDILSLTFSDSTLATCSSDKTTRLWETSGFTELATSPLLGHSYMINCCDFSPLGSVLATCSTDGTLRLWDTETGEMLAILSHPSRCALLVCKFSRDGALIVTGGDDDCACLWDVADRKLIRCFKGHEESVRAAAFSPDTNYFVTGSSGGDMCGELLVWDARFGHGKFLKRLPECHDLGVLCVEFSPTYGSAGKSSAASSCWCTFMLATGGKDNLIKLWNFEAVVGSVDVSIQLETMLPGHKDSVQWLCFSPDGILLASCSLDKTVRLWNTENKQALISIDEHSSYVTACAFSRNGQFLATASNDCTVKVWQLTDTTDIMKSLSGYEKGVETNTYTNSALTGIAMKTWTVNDVCDWLKSLGLAEHEDKFRVNAIDGKELVTLTDSDLQNVLQVEALGQRNKILRGREAMIQTAICSRHSQQLPGNTPEEFLCPITHELMSDPVIASDGYSYDRPAIVSWMSREQRSPMTNMTLTSTDLTPNRILKIMIQKFLATSM